MTITSPINNIAAALALAQNEIAVADKNQVNEAKKSRFADMESVTEACREALAKVGVSILQPLTGSATELLIRTVLLHSSGEFLESEFILRPENPNDTDSVKSLITQMRRYSLMGMLCIATADDDGEKNGKTPAKTEKKEPVQDPGPVIEKHEEEQPATEETPAAKETVSTSKQNDDWKEVVCHYGSDTSPAKGHKLGDLSSDVRKWLAEKVLPVLGKTKKDRLLAVAIFDSQKADSTPPTAADTLPDDKKAVETAKNAKETASETPAEPAKEEPMEWRSIVADNFKPNPKITLGEIADSGQDEIANGYDGGKILRGMKDEGIAKIQARKPFGTKDKILVNAILAANDEMDLREKVIALFEKVGFDDEMATGHLISNGVLASGETLQSTPHKLLAYILDQWSVIEATIKEAKK